MYQAGIKNITLYENTGINFRFYDPLNLREITDIVSSGAVILIDNVQQPDYDVSVLLSKSGKLAKEYKSKFYLFGLDLSTEADLSQLKTSIYGWCPLIEYYDGTFKFYNTPLFLGDAKMSQHKEMAYEVTMGTTAPTVQSYYDYTPGVPNLPYYRADTDLITADTEIYTADYEL